MKTTQKRGRREIISWGIFGTIGIAIGSFAGRFRAEKQSETIKLITADGKVMEVERRHLPGSKGHKKPVSNSFLQQWIRGGKV